MGNKGRFRQDRKTDSENIYVTVSKDLLRHSIVTSSTKQQKQFSNKSRRLCCIARSNRALLTNRQNSRHAQSKWCSLYTFSRNAVSAINRRESTNSYYRTQHTHSSLTNFSRLQTCFTAQHKARDTAI